MPHGIYVQISVLAAFAVVAMVSVTAQAPVWAHDGTHSAQKNVASPVRGKPWDFTLPTLDGSRFVQASSFEGPVLVNFWGRDCGPCITELPRLQAFAQAHPQWTVLLVSTDSTAQAQEFVQRHKLMLTVLRPGANVSALMRSAGNRSGGLPFSVTLRNGRVCESRTGELADSDLTDMVLSCR